MSQNQDSKGWQCPQNIKLRKGQQKIADLLLRKGLTQKEFLAILPTGYGKSFVALIAYQILKDLKVVNRMLLVVPTTIQQDQYVKNIQDDASLLGIDIQDVVLCEKQPYEIDLSHNNYSDIYVTTVQKLKDINYFYNLTNRNNWLVVADEMHHYAEESSWTNGFENLEYKRLLGLTATPLRKDKRKLLVNKEPDVIVTVRNAIQENALRPYRIERGDYEVQITCGFGDDEEVLQLTLSEIEEQITAKGYKDISDWELKRQVRYSHKYISGLFRKALEAYYQLEALYPNQNQILVCAWTCEHAKQIALIINDTIGKNDFAKAIGVGLHDEQTNKQIVQDYLDNKFPCLVQVTKAGEGFNNPRCVIGIMLNQIAVDTPTSIQLIGRYMRVQKYGSPNAVLFVGRDHPLANADLSDFGELPEKEDDSFWAEPPDGKEIGKGGFKLSSLNEFFVEVLRAKSWECIYPFKQDGTPNPEFTKALLDTSENQEIQLIIDKASHEKNPMLLVEYVNSMIKSVSAKVQETKEQGRGFTKQDKIKDIRKQIENVSKSFVLGCLNVHFNGNSVSSKETGKWFANLNKYLISKTGKRANERGFKESKECYQILQELTKEVNETGKIPVWLYFN